MRDAKKLRQHYFSTSHWRLDILSMLPTDFFYFWWGPNQCNFDRVPCAVIVRINRLFRLPRMWEWFERTETATGYPNAFRICKVSNFKNRYFHQIKDFFATRVRPFFINTQKKSRQHIEKVYSALMFS